MRNILEIGFPRTLRETPSIAIMGSGGGYRAMVGYSGAIRALKEIGVFDCATYTVGLSGSTWFVLLDSYNIIVYIKRQFINFVFFFKYLYKTYVNLQVDA